MLKFEIEGKNIRDFESFVTELNAAFISKLEGNVGWSGNFDALSDYLSWPDQVYKVVLRHSENLESRLGPSAFAKLLDVFYENRDRVELVFL